MFLVVGIPFVNNITFGNANNLNQKIQLEVPTIELLGTNNPVVKQAQAFSKTYALVTGYNTVKEQTDNTPCISASGDNICGKDYVVACPRKYPLGSVFQIRNKEYVCLDRLAEKYDDRFDINCNLDFECSKIVSNETIKILYIPEQK